MQSRLIVVGQVCFQADGEQPVAISEPRFVRLLETDERSCSRPMKVGEKWMPLDCGWFDRVGKVGLLTLVNELPRYEVQPTPEERAEAHARIVEVGIGDDAFACILPGEECYFQPANLTALRVRCRAGVARLIVSLIPH